MWFFCYFAGTYFGASLITTLYDTCIHKYKHIKRSSQEVLSNIKYMAPNVCFNMFGITLPYSLMLENYIDEKERNDYNFLVNFLLTFLISDTMFYWSHRLFHHPKLYWMHKKHHEYTYPLGFGAMYAHPVDYIVVNLIPYTAPVFILHPTDEFIKFVVVLAISLTVIQSHGCFTFLDDGHLKHHKYYKVNYGLGLMDRIMGTHS